MFYEIGFYYDDESWKIEKMKLDSINLLVGISGVGKTRTLQSFVNLKRIARGEFINGFAWDVKFKIKDNNYHWTGKFNSVNEEDIEVIGSKVGINVRIKKPRLIHEILLKNGNMLYKVDNNNNIFNNIKLPKTNQSSFINLFSGENEIAEIANYLQNMFEVNYDQEYKYSMKEKVMTTVSNEIRSLERLKSADIPIINKLCLLYRIDKKAFNEITNIFKSIFPFVKNIKFDIFRNDNMILYIQEDKSKWIPQHQVSSGMFKTLLHISELILLAPNSVVIIDEFENGLGLNCINELADIIINSNNIQYIMSSHHPYIINNFPITSWKILTRDFNNIVVKYPSELGLDISNHDKFKILINNDKYINGVK